VELGERVSYADERPKIGGLASLACFFTEQGWDDAEARRLIVKHSRSHGTLNGRDLRRAAGAVQALPRPLAENLSDLPPLPADSGYDMEVPAAVEVRAAREHARQRLLILANEVETGDVI
jgi:hypothetical protein